MNLFFPHGNRVLQSPMHALAAEQSDAEAEEKRAGLRLWRMGAVGCMAAKAPGRARRKGSNGRDGHASCMATTRRKRKPHGAVLHVRRAKKGVPSTHPIRGDELRALRKLQREQEPKSPFVFTSERNSPFSTGGFARMVERAGVEAKLGFKAHPHMLRHACGFALANKGHDTRALQAYLGHRNIQHTVRYTELSPGRFKDFWH